MFNLSNRVLRDCLQRFIEISKEDNVLWFHLDNQQTKITQYTSLELSKRR
jgi:hypothetical protein